MSDTDPDKALRDPLHRIDRMLQDVESFDDPEARARTKEIVQALMDYHGAGLERILERIASSQAAGQPLIDSLAQDDLVSSLLLLYGLHPLDLESRVRLALDKCRPHLHSHGGNVELLGIEAGVVRVRLQGSFHGCHSSAATLKQTIEDAINEGAPDVAVIEVESDETPHIAAHATRFEAQGDGSLALPVLAG